MFSGTIVTTSMFQAIQWTKLPLGASGSVMTMAMARTLSPYPRTSIAGEMSWPSQV
jgi:membrane carboxypeptidase/penicillin-binding protein PbpC